MKILYLFLLVILLESCFLFGKFKKDQLSFTENGKPVAYTVVIPKKFASHKSSTDSSGNQMVFYHYPDGTTLYFVRAADTSIQYQPINYALNIPKALYNTIFFKGIDSNGAYWRETRYGIYKIGYYGASPGEDWKFDSALNYFTLRALPQ
jgi:hypothetical protein